MVDNHDLELIEKNYHYYDGEKLLDRWLGPTIDRSFPHYEDIIAQIEKVLQSRNVIAECVNRYRDALVGKHPHWYFVDFKGDRVENDIASNAEKLLQLWLNRQYQLATSQENQLQDALTNAVQNMLIAKRGYLRLWTPQRFRNSSIPILRVCLHSPHPGSVTINRDKDGFTESIEYVYSDDKKERKEVQFLDNDGLTVFYTLDEKGIELPILDADNNELPFTRTSLDLGGRYTIYEMRSPSLITDSIKRSQDAINYSLTLMIRNLNEAGFRERIIMGATPPGRWEGEKFIPDEFITGPGRVNFISGVPLEDDTGNLRGYTNPTVYNSEPVNVQTFIDTTATFVVAIYHEMRQAHLLGNDLQLSGVSREQSRTDFETSLGERIGTIEAAISGIYGAALASMSLGDRNENQYKNLDVTVQLRLSVSKPTPDERSANREDYKAGLRSRTTAMAASGIDNPDGEQALLNEEQRSENAVEDVTSLLTVGAIDGADAIKLLKERKILPDNEFGSNTNEVLNGTTSTSTVSS